MDIYIVPSKNVPIRGKGFITVGDICKVSAPEDVKKKVLGLKIMDTGREEKAVFLISGADIIDVIRLEFPDATVHCYGEAETLAVYKRTDKKPRKTLQLLKVILISLIFAVGASSAIMSFHNDAEVPKVLSAYYKMFTGKEDPNPRAVQIPYSIGLALGIIGFFNHFMGKKLSSDPSPIEIEVTKYDTMINDAMTNFIKSEKNDN